LRSTCADLTVTSDYQIVSLVNFRLEATHWH
jgi:hypothetical protein